MSSSSSEQLTPNTGTARLSGPDVVRAIALLGVVVMNYRGYLILRGGERGDGWAERLFDPWTGPLSTRFAATFVLVAGVGVTLLTRRAAGDAERTRTLRWRLASRGLVLYGFGLVFDFVWAGSILPFYGAMFALAALMFTLRSAWIAAIGVAAAAAGWGIRAWRFERESSGHSTAWLTDPGDRSVRGLLFDLFVNGTHPLLPWLAFFCAGIILGRVMIDPRLATSWRLTVIGTGLVVFAGATIASQSLTGRSAPGTIEGVRDQIRWSTDPFDRGILYTLSALGTALVAFGLVTWLAERFADTAAVDQLRILGQVSLTVYVAHALVFNLLVDWWGWVEPGGVGTALVFALVVWVVAAIAAVAWYRWRGRGPFEHVYRSITA